MRGAAVVVALLLSSFSFCGPARAADEGPAAADALFAKAQQEDDAGDFARALADYQDEAMRFPSSRFAPKAATRADVLAAHAEGGFAPYARLESVRRDPKRVDDPAEIAALARDADAFPPGPTRAEARMVCGEAWLRMNRRADAERALDLVARDSAADFVLRRESAVEVVRAIAADGDFARARDEAAALGSVLDAKELRAIRSLARRRTIHLASVTDLALVALVALGALVRAAVRGELGGALRTTARSVPITLAFAVYVAAAGALLASSYETGNAGPFLALGVALAPIALLARAWGAAGSRGRLARATRAVACASAVFAAAFLVLERVNAQYLDGFSL